MSDDNKDYVNEVVWKDYEAGDSVEGILVDILENMGKFGNRLYKIRTDDAFVAVWGSNDLDKKMDKLDVSVGMNIRVTFNGLIRTDNGYDMKDFTVIILD